MKIKLGQLRRIIREVLEEKNTCEGCMRETCESCIHNKNMQEGTARELGNDPASLEQFYPEAYAALPEPYKNDRALTFYVDVNDNLCADHVLGGSYMWDEATKQWMEIE